MIYIRSRCWSSGSNGTPLEPAAGKRPNLNPRTRKLIRTRSVVFNEAWMGPTRMDTTDIFLPEEADDEEEEMLPQ